MSRPLYKAYYHEKKGLVIKDLCPADGTETRPQLSTKEPFSRLEPRMLTGPAWWYYEMITPGQDQSGGAWSLLAHIACELGKHARHDGFDIQMGKTYIWASIIIDRHLVKNITDRKAAGRLRLEHHSEYQRKYRPREERVLGLLRSYRDQASKG